MRAEAQLGPLVARGWELWERSAASIDTATVQPSMPILYFGDRSAYEASPVRFVTVGLNPSLLEFPTAAPWRRFPAAEPDAGRHGQPEEVARYLQALGDYFRVDPYREWFDRAFEPLLRGAGASYYPGAEAIALHTDIASPVATNPTWSRLGPRRSQHVGGARLWRDLIEQLQPDAIIVSVARAHLGVLTSLPLYQWDELTRVERERPFIVSETEVAVNGRTAVAVFGRCTNLPFGTVSHRDREWIGARIRERIETLPKQARSWRGRRVIEVGVTPTTAS